MSRFVSKSTIKTKNKEGGEAYTLPVEMDLYARVCTSTLHPQFYEASVSQQLQDLRDLIKQCDPLFVAQLAVYAREEMHLRTIPLVLMVELAKIVSGDPVVSKGVARVIQRADELTEILGYYALANNREGSKKLGKLSNQLRKGIATAFHKFDEYQFAKYNRAGEIKLRDALFLTHPKPESVEEKALFAKIASDTLKTPETWEVKMSKAGQTGVSKKETWEEMIMSRKMGYMATVRNLRNILDADVSPAAIKVVCNYLTMPTAVRNSKLFPFRFLAAYRELTGGRTGASIWEKPAPAPAPAPAHSSPYLTSVLEALETAVKCSAVNVPLLAENRVLIATDVSASMQKRISPKSTIENYDIGTVLAMIAHHATQYSTAGMFGNDWKVVGFPSTNILQNANELHRREGEVGYSTNGYKVLEWANRGRKSFDKIFIFTDCQLYGGSLSTEWSEYKEMNPGAKLYLFNLNPYGHAVPVDVRQKDVHLISGWSDKVFELLGALDEGHNAVDVIKKIQL